MPRILNIEILKKAEQPAISIRTNTKVEIFLCLLVKAMGKWQRI